MRFLLISFILVTFSYADEMQRIESIIQDIAELRSDYKECMKELESKGIEDTDTNVISDMKAVQTDARSVALNTKVEELEKLLYEKDKILKTKEERIEHLKDQNSEKAKTKDNDIISLENAYKKELRSKDKTIALLKDELKKLRSKRVTKSKPKIDDNPFPKLVMKDRYSNVHSKNEDAAKDKIESFKARTYRLKYDSVIYDDINGKKIDLWTKRTSFTSTKKYKYWIKITGYFVNQQWQKAKNDMWIKEAQVIAR